MDREETLTLFEKGKNAWNEWATGRLAEQKILKEGGEWDEMPVPPLRNALTNEWYEESEADFSGHNFAKGADFNGFTFPGNANFRDVQFSADSDFQEAIFSANAYFQNAQFMADVDFLSAHFSQQADFRDARFLTGADFTNVKFRADASFGNALFSGYSNFQDAHFFANADFIKANFGDDTSFQDADFHEFADFHDAKFSAVVDFQDAKFFSKTSFLNTKFKGNTIFLETQFHESVSFQDVHFFADADFQDAEFFEEAKFRQASFAGLATFDRTKYRGLADYYAIKSNSAFSLAEAEFQITPDFVEADFRRPPRLDNLVVEPKQKPDLADPTGVSSIHGVERAKGNGRLDRAARWRALKSLAIDAHDHPREMQFFAGEIIARRGVDDKRWHGAWLFGWAYQAFSDFGRSIYRPLLLLLLIWTSFSCVYAYLSPNLNDLRGVLSVPCVDGDDKLYRASLQLSFHKTLPIPSIGGAEKINQNYACLYGVHPYEGYRKGELGRSFTPKIPWQVSSFGTIQSIFSLVLLFLVFLAIRNHFRIR